MKRLLVTLLVLFNSWSRPATYDLLAASRFLLLLSACNSSLQYYPPSFFSVIVPPDHLLLDSAPNLGPSMSRWKIYKFEYCWYKSVRILEGLKLLFQQFLNLSSSQREMSGPILGDFHIICDWVVFIFFFFFSSPVECCAIAWRRRSRAAVDHPGGRFCHRRYLSINSSFWSLNPSARWSIARSIAFSTNVKEVRDLYCCDNTFWLNSVAPHMYSKKELFISLSLGHFFVQPVFDPKLLSLLIRNWNIFLFLFSATAVT